MRCFVCLVVFNSPEDLFNHLKVVHKICGQQDFICGCLAEFDNFGGFKKHVRNCFHKNIQVDHQAEQPEGVRSIDEAFEMYSDLTKEYSDEIADFKELVRKTALEMVLDMGANMSIPRNLVFQTITKFQTLITKTYIHGCLIFLNINMYESNLSPNLTGMKTIIVPRVRLEELNVVKRFIKTIETPFEDFNTECKLDSLLVKADLMEPIQRCYLKKDPIQDPLQRPSNDSHIETSELEVEEDSMTLMPISFTLKKFFELPKVFEKVEAHTHSLRQDQRLNHFIKGKIWNKKLEHFKQEDTVIPYFLYVDGAQVNNALGSHTKKGLLSFNYITLPTLPSEYQSKLENMFLASISPSK